LSKFIYANSVKFYDWSICSSGGQTLDSVDNPFVANGALSKKADYIISHSTITRTELHIADPDNIHQTEEVVHEEPLIVKQSTETQSAVTPVPHQPLPADGVPRKRNGKGGQEDGGLTSGAVEVEVSKATTVSAQPQHAEEVKLKQKKKCCVVQ